MLHVRSLTALAFSMTCTAGALCRFSRRTISSSPPQPLEFRPAILYSGKCLGTLCHPQLSNCAWRRAKCRTTDAIAR